MYKNKMSLTHSLTDPCTVKTIYYTESFEMLIEHAIVHREKVI